MGQPQPRGMQGLSLHAPGGAATVQGVADQRMAEPGHVDPDLVGSSGVQLAGHQTGLLDGVERRERRSCRFAGRVVRTQNGHAQPVRGVAPHRLLDLAAPLSQPAAMPDGQVFALHFARRDGPHQGIHCTPALAHQHEPGGVLVQPVHDAGPRQAGSTCVVGQQAIQQGTAPVAGRGVNHQPDRFADHQQVLVLVHDVQRHRLGHECHRLLRRSQLDPEVAAGHEARRRFGGWPVVQRHCPICHELLQIGSGELRHQGGQCLVYAAAVHAGVHHKVPDVDIGKGVSGVSVHLGHTGAVHPPRRYNFCSQSGVPVVKVSV